MKPSQSTLNLMRQSAGAVIAVAALSGTVHADVTPPGSRESKAHRSAASDIEKKDDPNKEEPSKEEPKKEPKKERDPCPACGLG